MEVPTVLTPTRIALQIAEQIVDTPVPRSRVRGSLPGQSSTSSLPESIEWVEFSEWQDLLLEQTHQCVCLEDTAWRPSGLGRRRG